MKYLKGFVDSVYLSYLGWFGGSTSDKTFYLLWTVQVGGDVSFSLDNCNLIPIRKFHPALKVHRSSK